MKELIDWIIKIEKLASNTYQKASLLFNKNAKLSSFLLQESEEEMWHAQVISDAASQLKETFINVQLDDKTKQNIETSINNCIKKIEKRTATEADVLDCMVTVEFSEWNDFFLYVLNSLKEKSRDFQYISSKIQNHLLRIKQFLSALPNSKKYIKRINELRPVWENRFLIVDDEGPILEFFKALIGNEKNIETATNGREGLEKLSQSHFDVVISDIYMPELNGIDFFLKATKIYPTIYEQFIFISSDLERHIGFFKKHKVKFISKPFSISDIRKMINIILQKNINKTE